MVSLLWLTRPTSSRQQFGSSYVADLESLESSAFAVHISGLMVKAYHL